MIFDTLKSISFPQRRKIDAGTIITFCSRDQNSFFEKKEKAAKFINIRARARALKPDEQTSKE